MTRRCRRCAKSQDVVIGVALVLSAVFIPTAFLPGITGRLYQQFALTIAISVIFSAFNALSLSPALVSLAASPAKENARSGWLVFRSIQSCLRRGDPRLRELVTHRHSKNGAKLRAARSARGRRGSCLDRDCRAVFCRKKTRATYFSRCNYRTRHHLSEPTAASRKIEEILSKIPGVQYTTSVVGFSLLSLVQNTYSAFFFVTFKPWSERTKPEEQYAAIKANINKQLAGLHRRYRLRVSAAGDSGRGHFRRIPIHFGRSRRQRRRLSRSKCEDVSRRGA